MLYTCFVFCVCLCPLIPGTDKLFFFTALRASLRGPYVSNAGKSQLLVLASSAIYRTFAYQRFGHSLGARVSNGKVLEWALRLSSIVGCCRHFNGAHCRVCKERQREECGTNGRFWSAKEQTKVSLESCSILLPLTGPADASEEKDGKPKWQPDCRSTAFLKLNSIIICIMISADQNPKSQIKW